MSEGRRGRVRMSFDNKEQACWAEERTRGK